MPFGKEWKDIIQSLDENLKKIPLLGKLYRILTKLYQLLKGLTIFLTSYDKREMDWWFFTILPILLLFSTVVFVYYRENDYIGPFMVCIQQFLSFSIVLSSTDLIIKSKSKKALDKRVQISPMLFIILASYTVLIFTYVQYHMIIESYINGENNIIYTILIMTLVFTYISIVSYNKNPGTNFNGSDAITEEKRNSEERASESFQQETNGNLTSENLGGVQYGDE